MLRSSLLVASIATLTASFGCSHEQKVTQSPAPAPTPRRVVASAGPAKPVPPPEPVETPKNKEDAIYFDFDSALVRDDARSVLRKLADAMHRQPASLRIEGNCDELGTVEYNLALGEQRARAAKEYLVHLGVSPEKIGTISFGAQRPKDSGHDETSHAQNRRDDFVMR